jgi:hypothetical protein
VGEEDDLPLAGEESPDASSVDADQGCLRGVGAGRGGRLGVERIIAVGRWVLRMLTGYPKQLAAQGDLAGEQVRRHGVPYFGDVQAEVERRLEPLAPDARKAFALACAERLMRWHEGLPAQGQRPFTLGWRPVLDTMWRGLEGVDGEADQRVQEALEALYASPYWHNEGQDGPDDADEDAAAASIYAAECFVKGDAEWARWTAERAVELAFRLAEEDLHLHPDDFDWTPSDELTDLARDAMHPAVQAELQKQLSDLSVLEHDGVSGPVLEKLRQGTDQSA